MTYKGHKDCQFCIFQKSENCQKYFFSSIIFIICDRFIRLGKFKGIKRSKMKFFVTKIDHFDKLGSLQKFPNNMLQYCWGRPQRDIINIRSRIYEARKGVFSLRFTLFITGQQYCNIIIFYHNYYNNYSFLFIFSAFVLNPIT